METPIPKNPNKSRVKPNQARIVLLLTVLLLIVSSIWFCFIGLRVVRRMASDKWPSLEGKVIDVNYQEYSTRRTGERGAAELTVRYEYKLNGQTYQSDEFMVGVKKYKREAEFVSGMTNEYRIGRPIRVLYNPKHPEQAALRSDIDLIDKLTLGFLAGVIGFIAFRMKPQVK